MAIDFIKVGESIAQLASRDSNKFHVRYNRNGLQALSTEKLNLPTLMEDVFTGCKNPVLEINAKQTAKHNVVEMLTKDGDEIITSKPVLFSIDEDVLSMLPETVSRLKKVTLGKKETEEIILNDENLKSVFIRPLLGAKNPNLEISSKTGKNFNITVLVLKDGDKTVAKGAYSESKDKLGHKIKKYHIDSNNTLSTGYKSHTGSRKRSEQTLNKELIEKIEILAHILPDETRNIIFQRFGLCGEKFMSENKIADKYEMTLDGIKYIIQKGLETIREYNLTPQMIETYKKYTKIRPKYFGHPVYDRFDTYIKEYKQALKDILSQDPVKRIQAEFVLDNLRLIDKILANKKIYNVIHDIKEHQTNIRPKILHIDVTD